MHLKLNVAEKYYVIISFQVVLSESVLTRFNFYLNKILKGFIFFDKGKYIIADVEYSYIGT